MPAIDISDHNFRRLQERAAALNITVARLADLTLDRAALEPGATNGSSAHALGRAGTRPVTAAEWASDWRAWVSTMPNRRVALDDGRDAIYGDRG